MSDVSRRALHVVRMAPEVPPETPSELPEGQALWLVEVSQRHLLPAASQEAAEEEALDRTVTRVLQEGGARLDAKAHRLASGLQSRSSALRSSSAGTGEGTGEGTGAGTGEG